MKLSKCRFTIKPQKELILPPYKGSTFRGGFGHAFRRAVCMRRKRECAECSLRNKCVYTYVFETSVPPEEGKQQERDVPHPFIIEPPIDERRHYGIDFYSMSETNHEGLHILKTRVSSPDHFIRIEEPETLPQSILTSIYLAGHDPKGDVEKIASERNLKAVNIRSITQGTFPLDADWLRASREIATYLLNLSAKKEIKTIELYLSIPIVIAFTIGMALGTQSPVTLNNWFPETKKYYPVLELNKLRQPR